MRISSIRLRKDGRGTQITVVQDGRSITFHLVNGVDVHGRTWDVKSGTFTMKAPEAKTIEALDPRPALEKEIEKVLATE